MDSSDTPIYQKAPRSLPGKIFDVLSGFGLATITMLLLGLLTWFATLEQIDNGLYPTLSKYFDWKSVFLMPELNGKMVPLPLPGGYWVCAVLLLNLNLGGIIRIRKGWRHCGNLISHFGIILMLVGGGVAHHFSERGNMAVGEGEISPTPRRIISNTSSRSPRSRTARPAPIHVIRGKDIEDLADGEAAHLPPAGHALRSRTHRLSEKHRARLRQRARAGPPAVRGRRLFPDGKTQAAESRGRRALHRRLLRAHRQSRRHQVRSRSSSRVPVSIRFPIASATASSPWTCASGCGRCPSRVKLDKFTAAFHPGTMTARQVRQQRSPASKTAARPRSPSR